MPQTGKILLYLNCFFKPFGLGGILYLQALALFVCLICANYVHAMPPQVDVFIDRQNELHSVQDAINLSDEQWKQISSSRLNLPVRNHHFWIKFEVEEIVEDHFLWFKYALIDTVRAWMVHPNDSIEYLGMAGNLVPHSQWPQKFRYPVFSIEKCVGCRIFLEGQKTTFSLSFSIMTLGQEELIKLQLNDHMKFGIGIGLGILLMFVSLIARIKLKLPLAGYYFFLAFCIIVYVYHASGFTFFYLFPETPYLNPYIRNFSTSFLPISTYLLIDYFLRIKQTRPIFKILNRINICIAFVFFIIGNSFHLASPLFISNLVNIGTYFTLYLVVSNFLICLLAYLIYRGNMLLLLAIGGSIGFAVGLLYVFVRIYPNLEILMPVTSFYVLYVYLLISFGVVLFNEIIKFYKGYQNAQQEILQLELSGMRNILDRIKEERNRLGRDLHDFVNPILTGSRLSLSKLMKQQKDFNKPLIEVDENISRAYKEIRRIAHGLTSTSNDISIKAKIANLISSANANDSRQIRLLWEIDEKRLDTNTADHISGMLHEIANNLIKHSDCEHCMLSIKLENGVTPHKEKSANGASAFIIIEYSDIEDHQANGNGMGRNNIATRIALLHGKRTQIKDNGRVITRIELPAKVDENTR